MQDDFSSSSLYSTSNTTKKSSQVLISGEDLLDPSIMTMGLADFESQGSPLHFTIELVPSTPLPSSPSSSSSSSFTNSNLNPADNHSSPLKRRSSTNLPQNRTPTAQDMPYLTTSSSLNSLLPTTSLYLQLITCSPACKETAFTSLTAAYSKYLVRLVVDFLPLSDRTKYLGKPGVSLPFKRYITTFNNLSCR